MDREPRPPGWFMPAIWAGLTGAAILMAAIFTAATP